jgi:hypothetical protein
VCAALYLKRLEWRVGGVEIQQCLCSVYMYMLADGLVPYAEWYYCHVAQSAAVLRWMYVVSSTAAAAAARALKPCLILAGQRCSSNVVGALT